GDPVRGGHDIIPSESEGYTQPVSSQPPEGPAPSALVFFPLNIKICCVAQNDKKSVCVLPQRNIMSRLRRAWTIPTRFPAQGNSSFDLL
ncbi:hypothetical protein, partial [Aerococcus loyolae]|uniref:hypothetical protein n=1 Tax=Aerococcus loyolae TaxID=2976809 RepID=UPI001C65B7E6